MKSIKSFIKELVPIILGILIALFINNWNEDRKDKKYINQMLVSINKELAETNEEIISCLPKQKSFIDTLSFYAANNEVSMIEVLLKNNGVSFPDIKINTWKAISNSKIELLDYKKVSVLANIEERKDNLKLVTVKLYDFLHANNEQTSKAKKDMMAILIQDVMDIESSIQKEIEEIINE